MTFLSVIFSQFAYLNHYTSVFAWHPGQMMPLAVFRFAIVFAKVPVSEQALITYKTTLKSAHFLPRFSLINITKTIVSYHYPCVILKPTLCSE
jgi:hypothetical protein